MRALRATHGKDGVDARLHCRGPPVLQGAIQRFRRCAGSGSAVQARQVQGAGVHRLLEGRSEAEVAMRYVVSGFSRTVIIVLVPVTLAAQGGPYERQKIDE